MNLDVSGVFVIGGGMSGCGSGFVMESKWTNFIINSQSRLSNVKIVDLTSLPRSRLEFLETTDLYFCLIWPDISLRYYMISGDINLNKYLFLHSRKVCRNIGEVVLLRSLIYIPLFDALVCVLYSPGCKPHRSRSTRES